jgi:hypothetical protein
MRLSPILLLTFLSCSSTAMAADDPFRDYADLLGHWACHGVFPASGKTINSNIRFETDLGGTALVKHHDDTAPSALYHAIEAWGYDAKAGHYNATILDNFGGARIFTSTGWSNEGLVWISAPEVKPAQRFVYVRLALNRLRIDWQVERKGELVVGDTLTCERQSS